MQEHTVQYDNPVYICMYTVLKNTLNFPTKKTNYPVKVGADV